MPLFYCFYFKI